MIQIMHCTQSSLQTSPSHNYPYNKNHHKLNGRNFPCLGSILKRISAAMFKIIPLKINRATRGHRKVQEIWANAHETRHSISL